MSVLAAVQGLIGLAGSNQAQKKLGEAGDKMFEAGDKAYGAGTYKPYGVTSGIGSTSFEDGQASFELDPRYQAQQDQMMGLGSAAFGAAGGDYNQLADQFYNQQRELGAGSRNAEAMQLGESMFGTGRGGLQMGAESLGAAGGGMMSPDGYGFAQAFAQQDSEDRYNAFDRAQGQRLRDLDVGTGMLNASQGLDRAGMEQQQLGGMLGNYRSSANNAAGNNLINAYGQGAGFMARRGQSMAGGMQGLGSSMGNWNTGNRALTTTPTQRYMNTTVGNNRMNSYGAMSDPYYNTDSGTAGNNPYGY